MAEKMKKKKTLIEGFENVFFLLANELQLFGLWSYGCGSGIASLQQLKEQSHRMINLKMNLFDRLFFAVE